MLFTSKLNFLSSAYLSVEPQANVGSLSVDLPILGAALVGFLLALELPPLQPQPWSCTSSFMASSVVCMMDCVIAAGSVAILSYFFSLFESTYLLCCFCLPS